jgi:hypothetical protein
MSLFMLTVDKLAAPMDQRFQEAQWIARALRLAEQAMRQANGTVTSGDIVHDGGVVIGSWLFTPQAAR